MEENLLKRKMAKSGILATITKKCLKNPGGVVAASVVTIFLKNEGKNKQYTCPYFSETRTPAGSENY